MARLKFSRLLRGIGDPSGSEKVSAMASAESGVRGLLIYCADYHCSHYITAGADHWPNHIRLSDLEPRLV
jgi:hypothetical protein